MDDIAIDAYLSRIGLSGRPPVTLAGLEQLQRAHLTAVPFENLDVFARRGVRTDLAWSIPKIVERRRGGWCFEVNGAFCQLLRSLGFHVVQRAATVLIDVPDSEPSHLSLEVTLDERYLVDVGFGDSFITPLRLDDDGDQVSGSGIFRLVDEDGRVTLFQQEKPGAFEPQYALEPDEWTLQDFDGASDRLRTTPGLSWTTYPFATRLLDGGPDRVTLLEDRLKFRHDGAWTESAVAPEDWDNELDRWFSMNR